MKKFTVLVLIIVLVFTVAACSNENVALSQIYQVDNGSLNIEKYNHTNVISDKAVVTQDLPAGQAKTVQINNQLWALTYAETIYYPGQSRKAHVYSIDGADEGEVLLNEDGSVYAILKHSIVKLDISKTASSETVKNTLEPEIRHIVDLSKYSHVEVKQYGEGGDFGTYSFIFYNELFGYRSDYTKLRVDSDGTVEGLWICDLILNVEDSCVGINKTVEDNLIDARLKGIYNTGTTEYRSRTLNDEPNFIAYENELYVEYNFTCKVYDSETERERSDGCTLLIPVHLLSEK